MSPKAKRKSTAKAVKKGARTDTDQTAGEGGSGNVMATGITGIDKYIDEFHDLEEKARGALIGYARTDIVKRNLVFGKYNKRDLNQQEKRTLLESFNQNGLDRFRFNHVVPLIVDKTLLDETTVVKLSSLQDAKRDGTHLPILKLKGDETVKNAGSDKEVFGPQVVAAGGRHRRYALVEWLKQREGTVAASASRALNELKKRSVKGDDDDDDPMNNDQLETAEAHLIYIQSLLNMGGSWIVSIYDKEKIETHGDVIGLHLATNQRLYSYAESAEEGIIQTYLMMVSNDKKWTDCEVAVGLRTKSNGYKIASLLQQDYIWKLMETIVNINETHYVHSDIFKISRLTNNLLSEHGGLLAAVVIYLENRLRLCFNDVEWDDKKIKKAQQVLAIQSSSQTAKEAANAQLIDYMHDLEFTTPAKGAINDELREQIDAIYKKTLGSGENWKCIGTDAPVWKREYAIYVRNVVAAITTMSEKMLKDEASSVMSDEMKRVWKTCASKAKFVLEMKTYPQEPVLLPFMSVSVWHSLSQQFKRVPKTLTEISSWFSPLLYNQKIVGGKWKIGSATAEMFRALSAHPDIIENVMQMCLKICTWTLVNNFGTLMRMEEQMTHIEMPKRPESAKVVKEYMLLEGEHKVSKPWKPGQQMVVARLENDSDESYLKKQLNLEAAVMDEAIKSAIKAQWEHRIPTVWLEPWYRQMNIPVMPGKDLYRTAKLLNYHTGYWGPTTASSESRARRETISAAIAEYCTIFDYRVPLLSQDGSAAAFIRFALELALSFTVDEEKGRQGPVCKWLTWPDSIEIDVEAASALSFDIVDENTRSLRIATRLRDQHSIQTVIDAVQSCSFAWPIPSNDDEPSTQSKSQPVKPDVASILENLVQTLVKSAYERRENIIAEDDTEDATMSEEDDEDGENTTKAVPKGIPKEDKLKLKFLHLQDDNELDLDEDHTDVNEHSTSISCLFSAFDNKTRLRALGQPVDEPSSQKTVATGSSDLKPTRGVIQKHIPFKVQQKLAPATDNVEMDMDTPPSSSLPDAFEDIEPAPSSQPEADVSTQLVDEEVDKGKYKSPRFDTSVELR
ncbi:hypothetical protein EV363DRAFT_1183630 [Boletus edulis]|nr:hypothetical protein EV363DRAFT_1183630 [Boletus edulis]